jgi:hypothetical protein
MFTTPSLESQRINGSGRRTNRAESCDSFFSPLPSNGSRRKDSFRMVVTSRQLIESWMAYLCLHFQWVATIVAAACASFSSCALFVDRLRLEPQTWKAARGHLAIDRATGHEDSNPIQEECSPLACYGERRGNCILNDYGCPRRSAVTKTLMQPLNPLVSCLVAKLLRLIHLPSTMQQL